MQDVVGKFKKKFNFITPPRFRGGVAGYVLCLSIVKAKLDRVR